MTSSYKYNEPRETPRDAAMTGGVRSDEGFIRLLTLFNENIASLSLSGADDDQLLSVENTSMSSFWYEDSLFDETSLGPCGPLNTSLACTNITDDLESALSPYATWQVGRNKIIQQ